MDSLSYAPRSNASTEHETAALASIYQFVLSCHEKKKAGAAQNTGHDAKGSQSDRAETSISDT